MKNRLFTLGIILVLCSCNNLQNQEKQLSEQETLPFFNKPDWTPEWINSRDSSYPKIHKIPAFSFLNQDGKIINEKSLEGKIYVANFFFTTCRSICTKMSNNMRLLQEEYKNDNQIYLLSHSVDPETDSVPRLKKYAEEHQINSIKWSLLTGVKSSIYQLAKKEYFAGDSIGFYQSGNEFLHTENFILIDKHRRIRGVYNGTLLVEIERIKEDIAILKKEH